MATRQAVGRCAVVLAALFLLWAPGLVSTGSEPNPKEIIVQINQKVSMKLALIPAGKFTMGSPDGEKDRSGNEGPQREVTISNPFYMGVYEVTQEQYEQVMGKNPSSFKGAQNPVESVSWDEAVEFCTKLSQKTGKTVRLPTEAEWEYACRAGSKTRFSYGDDDDKLGDYAWYAKNSDSKTHAVGQRKPNDWGLYDMHGNVFERCAGWFADSYASAKNQDPQGPDSGTFRVLRGGGWSNYPQYCRSAYRVRIAPGDLGRSIGFRVSVHLK
jgi:formylglycine-generating enzyme required for sulfatase activity